VELILESSVIVIVDENTEGIDVFEFTILLSESVFDSIHALSRSKNILDGEIHWVVEKSGKMVLIWTNVVCISVEALSHLEHASSLSVLTPEIGWDFWDGVDSNTVELIGADQVFDPVLKVLSDVAVGVLVEIWEISESAIFDLTLIVPVVDLAV
jgi:hypothetical protein